MNNDNFNGNNNNATDTYHATSNLNTAIENPSINVNSATGVNIENSGYNNYADNSQNVNSEFLNNDYKASTTNIDNNNYQMNNNNTNNMNFQTDTSPSFNTSVVTDNQLDSSQTSDNSSNENYKYQPVMQEKMRKDENPLSDILHSKEFKIMIFIIFILVLFLLLMPYIYDFFRELQMSITA